MARSFAAAIGLVALILTWTPTAQAQIKLGMSVTTNTAGGAEVQSINVNDIGWALGLRAGDTVTHVRRDGGVVEQVQGAEHLVRMLAFTDRSVQVAFRRPGTRGYYVTGTYIRGGGRAIPIPTQTSAAPSGSTD